MKHLFLNKELSLIAKEKGFDESCFGYFSPDFKLFSDISCDPSCNSDLVNSNFQEIAAPLYQQIIDWFREEHSIIIQPTYKGDNDNGIAVFYADIISNFKEEDLSDEKSYFYYPALDEAITEAFELI